MRLEGKVGIVVGAGQSPGETVGTGRAAAIVFAREGAKVLLADRDLDSARETAEIIAGEGGVTECVAADWTRAGDCKAFAAACVERWGRIDFLQNMGTGWDVAYEPVPALQRGGVHHRRRAAGRRRAAHARGRLAFASQ